MDDIEISTQVVGK